MANGDLVNTETLGFTRRTKLFDALTGIAGTSNGAWFQGREVESGSIEFLQDHAGTLTSFTAKVMGSNALDKPADSADGTQIGSDVSAVGLVALTTKCRWYKIKVTALSVSGGATLGARLHAHTF